MIALMVLTGDEALEAYEFRLLDIMEPSDADRELRREVRMLEKERDRKRVVRILTDEVASLEVDEEVGLEEG
jgi:hypothetical protein